MAETIKIGGELESTATGNKVADIANIKDKTKGNKSQAEINAETEAAIQAEIERAIDAENNRYTKSETYNKSELNNMITTPNQQYVSVTATAQTTSATDVLPATGAADTVYRVGNWDGSQFDANEYSEYAWNGTQYVHLSTKTQIGEVFDISAYHATGGTLATYADLSAALDSNNGGGVPQSLQKGGMRVQFVRTYDNKYAQYRLTTDEWSTTVTDWQGVDDEPTAESQNLVKSRGVYPIKVQVLGGNDFGATHPLSISSSGVWSYGNHVANHYIVPVTSGDTVSIKGDTVLRPQIAVLASYNPVQGENCVFATGWSEVDNDAEQTFVVPNDGAYLYVMCIDSSGYNHTPIEAEINNTPYTHKPIEERFSSIKNEFEDVDDDIEDINNDIAEQDSEIYGLYFLVNGGIREVANENLIISSDGSTSTSNGTALFIRIQKGSVIRITSNALKKAQYSLLHNYSTNPASVIYANGYTGYTEIAKSSTIEITAVEDASYLYIRNTDKYDNSYLPTAIIIDGENYQQREGYDAKIENLQNQIDTVNETIEALDFVVNGGDREPVIEVGSISSNGVYSSNGTCCFIPIQAGDIINITANNEKDARYSFAQDYNVQQKTITYAIGYTGYIELNRGYSSGDITAPEDANYLYIQNTDKYNTSYFPSSVIINGQNYYYRDSIDKRVNDVHNEVEDLREDIALPTFTKFGDKEAELVSKVLSDKDTNTITLGIITDTHNAVAYSSHRTYKQAYYIAKLAELVSAHFIVHLGDVIHGQNDTHQGNMDDFIEYWKQAHRTFIPTFYTIAHHEQYGNGEFQNYPISLHPEECEGVYGFMNRYIDVTWNSDKTCWYFDVNGVRFIGLNSSSNGSLGFSNEVIAFLQSALVSCTTKVVCMSHLACNSNVSYGVARNESDIQNLLDNYPNGVIAYLHGHTHWDACWKIENIPYIFWSTCCSEAVIRPFNYKHAPLRGVPYNYNRTVGDYSEFCFDIVNIHKDTNEIHSFRFGAGYDRIAKQGYAVSVGQTLTLESSLTGTVEWDIYDSTSGYVKDSYEQTATQVITRDVATINNGIVTALSTGESIAVSTDGKTKEFFFINVN